MRKLARGLGHRSVLAAAAMVAFSISSTAIYGQAQAPTPDQNQPVPAQQPAAPRPAPAQPPAATPEQAPPAGQAPAAPGQPPAAAGRGRGAGRGAAAAGRGARGRGAAQPPADATPPAPVEPPKPTEKPMYPYLDTSLTVEQRVNDLMPRLTLEEKVALCHGNSTFTTAGIPRLGVPPLVMDDGPMGVREDVATGFAAANHTDDYITAMPATLELAATWSTFLAKQYGAVIGEEAAHRGKNIMLGPSLNIQRTPLCGRNFEYMGEDPFLTSQIAVNYITGEQANGFVASCAKHFAANNQEVGRNSVNVLMDERTLREIYLPAFRAAVQQGNVLAVMGAYNQFRGQFCCQNELLLNTILKGEWGFKGLVMSDWGGVHDTMQAALNGMDMEMGTRGTPDQNYLGTPFLNELKAEKIPMSVLDDKARRHLTVMFKLHLIDTNPGSTPPSALSRGSQNTKAHEDVARYVAEEGTVLLKNEGDLLPLDASKLHTIAVIGDNATIKFTAMGGSARLKSLYEVTPFEGIVSRVNRAAVMTGGGRNGPPPTLQSPSVHVNVTFSEGYTQPNVRGGRGQGTPGVAAESQPMGPTSAELVEQAVRAARQADVVIYVGGSTHVVGYDAEGSDRPDMKMPSGQDDLIARIVAANPKTIVVLNGGGAVEMPWLDQVPAVMEAWYGGLESGTALAELLFGDLNPSGKLPCTFPKKLSDSPAHALDAYPGNGNEVEYKEGLLVGYRWYDTKQVEPLFPFGFGLSYTKYDYSNLKVAPAAGDKIPATGPIATVTCDVSNTGTHDGEEVVELYVHQTKSALPRPEKELKGFAKIVVLKGQKTAASIPLDRSAFEYYDPEKKMWVGEAGEYQIRVGGSSRDADTKVVNFTLKEDITDK